MSPFKIINNFTVVLISSSCSSGDGAAAVDDDDDDDDGFITTGSQKFSNILLTYLLYSSSYNKSCQALKVEAFLVHRLKSLFFDLASMQILVFQGKELFHWSFYLPLSVSERGKWVMNWNK